MSAYNSVLEAVGHTPVIRLNRLGAGLKLRLWAKFEAVNPGGSIKDRLGVHLIEEAELRGELKPGGTIVEATAGNTGVGLAIAAAVKGYHLIVVMPDKMSEEKASLVRAFGGEVVRTPTNVAPDDPESYVVKAKTIAAQIPGAWRAAQFENLENPRAHELSTGPEIWNDLQGHVDVLVAGIGTGGTISGIGHYLRSKNPNLTVVGADPEGSILSGDQPHGYKVEGIGEDYFPMTYDKDLVNQFYRISDGESFRTARRLAREEGIFAGGSSGTAVAAALQYAQEHDREGDLVVILPDTGRNYLGKFYNDQWMKENGYEL